MGPDAASAVPLSFANNPVGPIGAKFVQNQNQDALWSTFDSSTEEEKGLDIWGFLNRRKAFVIVLAIVGSALGYVYYKRQPSRYSSTASLQVIHHGTDPRVENLLAEQSLSDAQFEVTSNKLLTDCLSKIGETTVVRGYEDQPEVVVRRVASMMNAYAVSSNMLHLNCEGDNPTDTMIIANAVADEYKKHQENNYTDAVKKLEELLNHATTNLQEQLAEAERKYREWEEDSPLDSRGENPHTRRLAGIQERLSSLVLRETELKAELMALQDAIDRGDQRDALMLLVGKQSEGEVGDTPDNAADAVGNAKNLFEALFPLLMKEAILVEEVGPGHPKLKTLRKQIELTKKHFEQIAGIGPDSAEEKEERPVLADFLTIYMNSLRQELSIVNRTQKQFQDLEKQEEKEAKSLRGFEHERRDKEREIARLTAVLGDVQQQITELPTNQLGGVTVTVMNAATAGRLVYPMPAQFLGIGAFLGAFVGLLLGYIVEAADRSFRKPDEIIREFGVPIVGHIPYMAEKKLRKIPSDTVIDRTVISLHLPRSRPSEAYRSVRTAVCFSAQGKNHRVIQVTSPAAGDGKSTLAMNFAVSLAQSGKRTIIIESDFRRPKVHKLTGVENRIGVVDVLRGQCELSDAIRDTELENFFVMPCGSRPKDPSELLARPEYEDLIAVLREKFDYVVIDTPPVLVVTDPCSVAPRADGVLLCVRLSRHTRDFGRRSLEQLRDVGARMSGIVVNGVDETDTYGYGSYSYSDYRYSYKDYSYNYGYSDQQEDGYFAESEDEVESDVRETPRIS